MRSCTVHRRGWPRRAVLIGGLGLAIASLLLSRVGLAADAPSIQGTVIILDREGKPKAHHDGVVVFLDELERPAPFVPPTAHAAIRQANKTFLPETLPIVVGTTVEFPNDDTIYHNVFSLSKAKPFDLGLYAQGESKPVTFDQPGLVKVYCNIHPDMVANILVLSNPHFIITEASGRFVIPDVPLGAATVRSWYARSREHPQAHIVVTAQGIQDLNFQVAEEVRLQIQEETIAVQHKNKWGQDYPAKY